LQQVGGSGRAAFANAFFFLTYFQEKSVQRLARDVPIEVG
jgi:hypothetical protein